MDRYQIEICRLAADMGFSVLYEEFDDSCELWKDGKVIASIYEDFEMNPLMASFESQELLKSYHKLMKAVDRTREFAALYENGFSLEDSPELPYVRVLASGNGCYLLGADLGPFQGFACWTVSAGENTTVFPATKFHTVKKEFLKKSGLVQPDAN